ncbi:Glutamine--fructose-6-phosphate transaminase [Sphingopyxis sp. LC81]|uniref:SIS domain-containing protein n=1 Tax=Sphingopyxis sp. LC81 TaxID=1502850 RepID=UPI00050FED7D|nr:SIS domain-containing protein [Sphingopyxis sp. LC81]KGB51611.1 Glutamine--fructose-6-phosphate transaminase [Sphingopyxis sp. LC81]
MTPNAASDGRQTLMEQEAGEAAGAVARMLEANRDAFAAIARRLRASPPAAVVTCARGSSDHAATYAKYLIETMTGTPTASAALSIASLYDVPAVAGNRLCLAISQSGKSPDLLAAVEQQRDAGAFVVVLVNAEGSPLAALADVVIPLSAGVERSVAATKSYIASLAAIAALVAAWAEDAALENALTALPDQLAEAFALDWSPAVGAFQRATNLFVLGRGYGLGVAQEAALKFKETSGLHAESFSAAEVRHGPMAIVGDAFHVLALGGTDRAAAGVRDVADEFRGRGATVLLADPAGGDLPAIAAHPAIEPILLIQSFYRMASALALARGHNPDSPPHLNKVTETL